LGIRSSKYFNWENSIDRYWKSRDFRFD